MKKFATFILIWFIAFTISAQEPEPTPSVEQRYDWSHTLYFPQQLDLFLLAKLPDSQASAITLTIDYDNTEPFSISLDTIIAIPTNQGTAYSYTWMIPEDNPPPLFSTMRYRWEIVTIEGEQINVLDDFIFEDTRFNWARNDDVNAQVNIYHVRGQADPDEIRSGIRETYDLLFENVLDKPTFKLLVYPEDTPVGCALNEDDDSIIAIEQDDEIEEVPCNLELVDQIIEEGNFVLLNQSGNAGIQQTVIERIVEAHYTDLWANAEVPAWVLRGLQSFYDPRPDIEALALAQQSVRSDDLLSLDELAVRPTDDDFLDIWDAQSTGLVLYIADTIGVDGLFELVNNLDDSQNFADAYEDTVGTEIDLLLVSWQDWLFSSSTADDYEYHPYLPDTATPTVTPTATNTPTPTFTPSATPNVTSTPRPTFTLIPPTATITPLPAQSFSVQSTEEPPAPAVEDDVPVTQDEDFVTRLAIGGGVILVLLVILFFVLRQR